jgi:hypothetical protein
MSMKPMSDEIKLVLELIDGMSAELATTPRKDDEETRQRVATITTLQALRMAIIGIS